jgi:hypothetical protein
MNKEHLHLLRSGVKQWNEWRIANPNALIDLSESDLSRVTNIRIAGANLSGANLRNADLSYSYLKDMNCEDADLTDARLINTNLAGSCFRRATLLGANISRADLYRVDLTGANLRGARLVGASLVETILVGADLTGCSIYGAAVWKVVLGDTKQSNLIISPPDEPTVTVDHVRVAQFIYLLLDNRELRHVIDSITSKVVLILGRFTPERKSILDAIRDELRKRDYLPVLFDFEKPSNRDITETVSTLAHMARFVIADLSDPKSIPHELAHVVPLLPSVPIMSLIVRPQKEYSMFEHFFGFRHVLKPFRYRDEGHLLASLETKVILPAEKLANRVAGKRSKGR